MLCKQKPSEGQRLTCVTCITPWHVACLLVVPETLALAVNFECPDCSGISLTGAPAPVPVSGGDLISKICAIEAESSLTEIQKAKRKQQLLSGKAAAAADSENDDDDDEGEDGEEEEDVNDVLDILSASFMCAFCWKLPEKPVTEVEAHWTWKKQPPASKEKFPKFKGNPKSRKRARKPFKETQHISVSEQVLRGEFAGQEFVKERSCLGGRKLRSRKNIMKCPCRGNDIAEFLQNPQVNRELMNAIEQLQRKVGEIEKADVNQSSGKKEANSAEKKSDDVANSSISILSSAEAEGTGKSALKRKIPDTDLPAEQTTKERRNKKGSTSGE